MPSTITRARKEINWCWIVVTTRCRVKWIYDEQLIYENAVQPIDRCPLNKSTVIVYNGSLVARCKHRAKGTGRTGTRSCANKSCSRSEGRSIINCLRKPPKLAGSVVGHHFANKKKPSPISKQRTREWAWLRVFFFVAVPHSKYMYVSRWHHPANLLS